MVDGITLNEGSYMELSKSKNKKYKKGKFKIKFYKDLFKIECEKLFFI
jgi:hypothetical protein